MDDTKLPAVAASNDDGPTAVWDQHGIPSPKTVGYRHSQVHALLRDCGLGARSMAPAPRLAEARAPAPVAAQQAPPPRVPATPTPMPDTRMDVLCHPHPAEAQVRPRDPTPTKAPSARRATGDHPIRRHAWLASLMVLAAIAIAVAAAGLTPPGRDAAIEGGERPPENRAVAPSPAAPSQTLDPQATTPQAARPRATQVQTEPEPPTSQPQTPTPSAAPAAPATARDAVDALASARYGEAAARYRQLAAEPGANKAFGVIAQLLAARMAERGQ